MKSLILSIAIGLTSGVICFFLCVALLSFVLLIVGAVSHSHPDMTLTYKTGAPIGALAVLCGFVITLVRRIKAAAAEK